MKRQGARAAEIGNGRRGMVIEIGTGLEARAQEFGIVRV
jgi:hypothetical protein